MENVTPELLIFLIILQNIVQTSVNAPLDQNEWSRIVRFAAETARPLVAACRALGIFASLTGQTVPRPAPPAPIGASGSQTGPRGVPLGVPSAKDDAFELAKRFARGEGVQGGFQTLPAQPIVTPLPPQTIASSNGNGANGQAEIAKLLNALPPALRGDSAAQAWLDSVKNALHIVEPIGGESGGESGGGQHADTTQPANHQAGT